MARGGRKSNLVVAHVAVLLAVAAGAFTWFLPPEYGDVSTVLAIYTVAFAISSLIVVVPTIQIFWSCPRFAKPDSELHRPMWRSVISGAILAGLLTLGGALSLVSIFERLERPSEQNHEVIVKLGAVVALALAATTCVLWISFFGFMWSGKWSRTFETMYTLLFAGTMLELAFSIPVDAWVRCKSAHYFESGTIISMAIGLAVGMWVFAPGLYLSLGNRFGQWVNPRWFCRTCRQDMRPFPDAPTCTRCGSAFTAPRSRSE